MVISLRKQYGSHFTYSYKLVCKDAIGHERHEGKISIRSLLRGLASTKNNSCMIKNSKKINRIEHKSANSIFFTAKKN